MIRQLTNTELQAGFALRRAPADAQRKMCRPIEYDLPGEEAPDDFDETESEGGEL